MACCGSSCWLRSRASGWHGPTHRRPSRPRARRSISRRTPDCQYAWGEADAAQVWGEAYFANHEPALAHRAFTQALAVRKRIEHPGVADTEKWLAMTAV